MPRMIRTARSLGLATLMAFAAIPVTAQQTEGFVGSYLAARSADANGDFRALVEYGARTLAERPDNTGIMEGLLVAQIGLGAIDAAVPVARRLIALAPENDLGHLVLLGDAMAREDWAEVEAILGNGFSVGGLMDPLILAWAAIGDGRMSKALEIFDDLSKDEVARQVSAFQKAQALAYVGDFENAAKILSGDDLNISLNRSGIIAYAQILSQLERNDDAIALIDAQLPTVGDEEIATLRAELETGKPIPFDAIKSPKDGLSALFYNVGEALANEASPSLVMIYARLSQYLNPNNIGATLLTASVFEDIGNHALAVETYDQIDPKSRAWPQAMMGKADALRRSDQPDAAIATLEEVATKYPDLSPIHIALGDSYRYEERWQEAVDAYDAAVALFADDVPQQWAVYFARGIVQERSGDWDAAETDLRKALALEPNQPAVLNYLGYSYVEKGENLEEALDMIQKAVEARPNEGYIVDSLGWAHYRLGRYGEAVGEMEKAVSLMPVDPVVNDHLGDVYWAVGRTREAEFQWKRALSFVTDESNVDEVKPDRIRRKLEIGLDKVLEEDGEPPLVRQENAAAN